MKHGLRHCFLLLLLGCRMLSFAQHADCIDAYSICENTIINFNSDGPGADDFASLENNHGCLLLDEHQSAWLVIQIDQNSPADAILNFTIDPQAGFTGDYDFAVYGPGATCQILGLPIRCSYAGDNASCTFCPQTGLGNGEMDFSEGADGNGFVQGLPTQPGDVYYILIDNFQADLTGFEIIWEGDAILDCDFDCLTQAGEADVPTNGNQSTSFPIEEDDYDHYFLCDGDAIDIYSKQNFILPEPATGEASEFMWAIYNDEPPAFPSPDDLEFSGTLIDNDSIADINVQGMGSLHSSSDYFLVAVTADDGNGPNNQLGIDSNQDSCYSYGRPLRLTFLEEITYWVEHSCDYPTFTINGGQPETDDTKYTISNVQPSHALPNNFNPRDGQIFFVSNLAIGENFSFDVTDEAGCMITINEAYNYNQPIPEAIASIDGSVCDGDDLMLLGASSVSGAFVGYTWNGPNGMYSIDKNPIVSPAVAGTYYLSVFVDGCTSETVELEVVVQPKPDLNYISPQSSCESIFDLRTVTITGSNLANTEIRYRNELNGTIGNEINPVINSTGTYWIEVYTGTPPSICSAFISVYVRMGDIDAAINQVTNVACAGQDNGSININVSGGQPPYDFIWSSGQNTGDIYNLAPGDYTLTVTDNNNCTDVVMTTITAPDPFAITLSQQLDPTCFNLLDGILSVEANGGTEPYFYNWSAGGTEATINNLEANITYSVTVYDAAGCSQMIDNIILEEAEEITAYYNSVASTCGLANGSSEIDVMGGTGIITYTWSHDANLSGPLALDLLGGAYQVTIVDGNGCELVLPIIVNDEVGPEIEILTLESEQCFQNDGAASVLVTGGTGEVQISWSHDTDLESNVAENLAAGDYYVSATDANNCVHVTHIEIDDDTGPIVTLASTTPASCPEAIDGAASILVEEGTFPYIYRWTHDISITGPDLVDALPGIYFVEVSDAKGCFTIFSFEISYTNSISLFIDNMIPATCGDEDGSVVVSFDNATLPVTFEWGGISNGDSPELNNVAAGTYTVTATDANGCNAFIEILIANVDGPMGMTNLTQPNGCTSSDGSIEVMITGGTSPYDYTWSHDTGHAGPIANDLEEGKYFVTIEDLNGCKNVIFAELEFDNPNPVMLDTLSVEHTGCQDSIGAIYLETVGGTVPYTYEWFDDTLTHFHLDLPVGTFGVTVTDAAGCTATLQTEIEDYEELDVIEITQFSPARCGENNGSISINLPDYLQAYWEGYPQFDGLTTVTGLGPRTYVVGATSLDEICIKEQSFDITSEEAPTLILDSLAHYGCSGFGHIRVLLSSHVENETTYAWSHNVNLDGPEAAGLLGGNYQVTAEDKNGCVLTLDIIIEENTTPPTLTLDSSSPPSCGQENGMATVNAMGGFGQLTYAWSHNPFLNNPTADNLPSGNYIVTVTDESLCESTISIDLTIMDELSNEVTTLLDASCGDNNGEIILTTTGGATPYIYVWSHNAVLNSNSATNLAASSYQVTVSDQTGCEDILILNITNSDGPTVQIDNVVPPDCETLGSISIEDAGVGYTYVWSHDANLNTFIADNLVGGEYTVIVIDPNGCQALETIDLPQSLTPQIEVTTINPASCGQSNGGALLTITDEDGPSYTWSHDLAVTTPYLTDVPSGDYTVTVTNANGCSSSLEIVVPSSDGPQVAIDFVDQADCNTGEGAAGLSVQGAAPFSYKWSHDATIDASTASNLPAQEYWITVTDALGCSEVGYLAIPEGEEPVINVDSVYTDMCDGGLGRIYVSSNQKAAFRINCGSDDTYIAGPDGSTYFPDYFFQNGITSSYFSSAISNRKRSTQNFYGKRRQSQTGFSYSFPLPNESYKVIMYFIEVDFNPSPARIFDVNIEGQTVLNDFDIWQRYGTRTGGQEEFTINLTDGSLDIDFDAIQQIAQVSAIEIIPVAAQTNTYQWSANAGSTTDEALDLYKSLYRVTVTDANGCTSSERIVLTRIDSTIAIKNVALTTDSCGRATGAIDFENSFAAAWRINCGSDDDYTTQAGAFFRSDFIVNGTKGNTASGIANTLDDVLYQTTRKGNFKYFFPVANGCYNVVLHVVDESENPLSDQAMNVDIDNVNYLHDYNLVAEAGGNLTAHTDTINVNVTDGELYFECYAVSKYTSLAALEILPCFAADFTYNYTWSHDPTETGAAVADLGEGSYKVTISNDAGCEAVYPFEIEASEPIQLLDIEIDPSHCGQDDGQIDIEAVTGNLVYNGKFELGAFGFDTEVPLGRWQVSNSPVDQWGGFFDCGDHTSGSGQMLIVTPNDVADVWCQDIEVEVGVDYTARAFVTLVNGATTGLPKLQFYANGFTIGNSIVPDNTCVWQEMRGSFTSSSTSVTLCIKDLVSADGPNDCAIDDIALYPSGNVTFEWAHDTGITSNEAQQLAEGIYPVRMVDAFGCHIDTTIAITEATPPALSLQDLVIPDCDMTNGSITLSGSPILRINCGGGTYQSVETGNNFAADNYGTGGVPVLITDDILETDDDPIYQSYIQGNFDYQLPVTDSLIEVFLHFIEPDNAVRTFHLIAEDENIAVDYSVINGAGELMTKHIQKFNLTVTDGVLDLKGIASNGNPLICAIEIYTSNQVATYTWSHDGSIDALQDGDLGVANYQIDVIDIYGCTDQLVVDLPSPQGPEISLLTVQNATACLGVFGYAIIDVESDKDYEIAWSHDPLLDGEEAVDLTKGSYTVVVTDDKGCTDELVIEITDSTIPDITIVDVAPTNCQTQGGAIEILASGGVGSFDYSWSHDVNLDTTHVENLPPGMYEVTVTDKNGCAAIEEIEIIGQSPQLDLVSMIPTACNEAAGSIEVTDVGNGVGVTTYSWSHDDALTANVADDLVGDTYIIIGTDEIGCSDTLEVVIPNTNGPAIDDVVIEQPTECGGVSGAIAIISTQGQGMTNFAWSHDSVLQDSMTSNLAGGIYSVTVSDANGCTNEANFEILSPPIFDVVIGNVQIETCEEENGSIQLYTTGGTAPFVYAWSHDATLTDGLADQLSADSYEVTITDDRNCEDIITVVVDEVTSPVAVDIQSIAAMCDSPTGSIEVEIYTQADTLNYAWSHDPLIDSSHAQMLAPGDYTLTVTDNNGCSTTEEITVDNEGVLIEILEKQIVCDEDGFEHNGQTFISDTLYVSSEISAIGCDSIHTLDLRFGQSTEYLAEVWTCDEEEVGTYTDSLLTSLGCDSLIITEIKQKNLDAYINAPDIETGIGQEVILDIETNITVDSIFWLPEEFLSCQNCLDPTAQVGETTTFTIYIIDDDGCELSQEFTIYVSNNIGVYMPNAFSPNGDGTNDFFMVFAGSDVASVSHFEIHDRWGERLYEAHDFPPNDPSYAWDGRFQGKILHPQVCSYFAEVQFHDGSTQSYAGYITVVR